MSEQIIHKTAIPDTLPAEIVIKFASRGFTSGSEQIDKLTAASVEEMIENIRSGRWDSLFLSLDPDGDLTKYLLLESKNGEGRIFLQIESCEEENEFFCASFDSAYMDSDEESAIETSDEQSIILKKYTMKDRELAAKCVEWFIHTGEPYPGMDWLKG